MESIQSSIPQAALSIKSTEKAEARVFPMPVACVAITAYLSHPLALHAADWRQSTPQVLVAGLASGLDQNRQYWKIADSDIPDAEPYHVLVPIPVTLVRHGLDFTASWDEANIAIGGESFRDAFQALVLELLDAYDHFSTNQSQLGLEAERQFDLLKKHLVRVDR